MQNSNRLLNCKENNQQAEQQHPKLIKIANVPEFQVVSDEEDSESDMFRSENDRALSDKE